MHSWDDIVNDHDVHHSYRKFINVFSETFNSSFPVRPGSPQKRKHKPWMTNGLVNACKKKNLLYKRFLTSRCSTSEIRYKTYKNKLTSILRYCEKQYYSDLLKANKNNMKETWKIINDLLNKKSSTRSSYPTEFMKNGGIISGNMNIAEHFNSFFTNIGPTLAEGIPKSDRHVESFLGDRVTDSIFLNPVTDEELLNIVHNAKDKKSKGYDGIDMCMLKKIIPHILTPLRHICNTSLSQGIFPDEMKIARIIPLFKSGDKQNVSNYRPISLLPQFSKILEKIFNNRLMNFLNSNNLLYLRQYGFRKNMSTSMAIMELVENITNAMDNGKFTIGVFIDLKKAFDTVDHNILVTKLDHYGIRGVAKKWLSSYLENRKQYVCFNGTDSGFLPVSCGVPQGSILGPSLFLLYINDLCNVSTRLTSILFADDTSCFIEGTDLSDMCIQLSTEMNKLSTWFKTNRLSLNVSKTNCMIFGRSNQPDHHRVYIDNIVIERVDCNKFLGVIIDSKLSWSDHVSYIRHKMSKNLSVMHRVKWLLNNSALYMIYCTLVLPYISYCCEIWGNTYKTRVQPLYIIQKRAIRICNHLEYRSHTKPAFLKLNTLTIADLVKFKSMVLMYKIYNNLMPSNILSYFCMVHMSHDHDTRQAGHFKNMYCRTTLKSMCLSIRGPVLWNKLHSDLKNSTTVNMFKKRYKTFLVSEYEAT